MFSLRIDWGFLVISLFFCAFSLSLIWSTNPNYFVSQLTFFIVGYVLFLLFSQIDRNIFSSFPYLFYGISILFLLFSLLSPEVRGASRWIEIMGIVVQPSEVIKPFIIVSFASIMTYFKRGGFLAYFIKAVFYFLPILMIFIQPDLGNVIIYIIFLSAMTFANKLNFKIILLIFIGLVIMSPIFWHTLRDYQKDRILTFINPESDPQGAGYNAIQAVIAVGSGRVFGWGLGRGTQSHLRFLPENHTDFIFASLTEELGLFSATLLILFYLYLLLRIIHFAASSDSKFAYLTMIGIFVQILSQMFINISMNMGLIPITGVTLPLISSGGSSIIATFISLGIIVSLKKEKKAAPLVIR